jgi:hypothetical protein
MSLGGRKRPASNPAGAETETSRHVRLGTGEITGPGSSAFTVKLLTIPTEGSPGQMPLESPLLLPGLLVRLRLCQRSGDLPALSATLTMLNPCFPLLTSFPTEHRQRLDVLGALELAAQKHAVFLIALRLKPSVHTGGAFAHNRYPVQSFKVRE